MFLSASPEAAPPYVVLAQVLQLGGLNDQLVDLVDDVKLFVGLEVTTSQLLLNPVKHLDGSSVLALGFLRSVDHIAVVSSRAVGTRPGASHGRTTRFAISEHLRWCHIRVQDGVSPSTGCGWAGECHLALALKVGTGRRSCAGQTPREKRIVNELDFCQPQFSMNHVNIP